jgi:signal transduction histidine kinase
MKFSEFRSNNELEQNFCYSSQKGDSKVRDLEAILNVIKNINSSLIVDDVLRLVLTNAIELTGLERGFIVLKNQNGMLEYKLGMDANGLVLPEHFFNISNTVVEEVFHSGQSRFIEGTQSDFGGFTSKSILNLSLQTILCTPLIINQNKIGVLYVDSKYLKRIRNREIIYTFEILAGQAAIAIYNAQLYEELNTAKDEAEKSDKLKSEFLSQISHEIRTPINAILNSTSLIKEEFEKRIDKSEYLDFFDITESASRRIIRTVELVLNMSQVTTGTYIPNKKEIDLVDDVIDNLVCQFKPIASSKKLSFDVELGTKNTKIKADEYSINQIFNNLFDNAVKYTSEGGVKIAIGRNQQNKLFVSVKDTGIGISKEFLPILFSSFTQEYQGYTRKFDGNGLGLALAKKYCEINSANIFVDSVKGVGTEFKVVFKS